MPEMESTPDFLVYMLSARASRAKAAVAASRAVVRTMVVFWKDCVQSTKMEEGAKAAAALNKELGIT